MKTAIEIAQNQAARAFAQQQKAARKTAEIQGNLKEAARINRDLKERIRNLEQENETIVRSFGINKDHWIRQCAEIARGYSEQAAINIETLLGEE